MGVARTSAVSLIGLDGQLVEVEADISNSLPAFVIIGLPDTALAEARDRVRSAAHNSGCALPPRRFTVGLSPASLPKQGSAFDLAIALSCFGAAGVISAESIARTAHLGELGLDGRLRPVDGILPAVLAAKRHGVRRVMVPTGNLAEAKLVSEIEIVPVASLRDAAIFHGAKQRAEPCEVVTRARPGAEPREVRDLAEVVGQRDAVRALIAAAAGGHHVFMVGSPGAGKTMLASRLPGILPKLTTDHALEVASLRSLSGLGLDAQLDYEPPFENPHHTASAPAVIGGGTGLIRPGAASRASHGVLFLDEAPEFSPKVLDVLRQPLESGEIRIIRAQASASFPAKFQLVLAANPCPCGRGGDLECTCAPQVRRRYLSRISGPLLDRVDIQIWVPRLRSVDLRIGNDGLGVDAIDSSQAAERVASAREVARSRLAATPWRKNVEVPGSWFRDSRALNPGRKATLVLDTALERGVLTMRGYDRVTKLAWTLADLDHAGAPRAEQFAEALAYRVRSTP